MHQSTKVGRALAAFAIAMGVAAIPVVSKADNPAPAPAPDTAAAEVVTGTATIQKIDKDSRLITLKGSQGTILDVKASPDVNLAKLKVGDRVNAAYYREVAVALKKSGEQGPKMTQTVTERGGITAQQTTVTAKVLAVDTAANSVALRGPAGGTHVIQVQDPDLQAQLGKIKAGDSVDVTYTQAVAVSVEPAK
jgi:Cu/Ag efflux protein CusF